MDMKIFEQESTELEDFGCFENNFSTSKVAGALEDVINTIQVGELKRGEIKITLETTKGTVTHHNIKLVGHSEPHHKSTEYTFEDGDKSILDEIYTACACSSEMIAWLPGPREMEIEFHPMASATFTSKEKE